MKGLRKKLFGSRRRKAVAAILTLVLVGGSAFGAWSVLTASGTGSGGVGSLIAPTITGVAAPTGDTFPRPAPLPNTTGSLQLSINNPNTSALFLKGFTIDDNLITISGQGPGCDATAFRTTYFYVGVQDNPADAAPASVINGLSVPVPVGTSNVSVANMLGLVESTPSDCQGASIAGLTLTNASFSTAP